MAFFFPTEDLKTGEVMLRLTRTCEAQPEKGWVPAYYFDICLPDGTRIGECDLRIGHNSRLYIGGSLPGTPLRSKGLRTAVPAGPEARPGVCDHHLRSVQPGFGANLRTGGRPVPGNR